MALGIAAKVTGLPLLAVPLLVLGVMGGTRRAWLKPLALAYVVAIGLIAYPVWRFFSRPSGELSKLAGSGGDDSPLAAAVSANVGLAASWLWRYWTPGLVLLAAAGLVVALRTSDAPAERRAAGPRGPGPRRPLRDRVSRLVPALRPFHDRPPRDPRRSGFPRLAGRARPTPSGLALRGRGSHGPAPGPRPGAGPPIRRRALDRSVAGAPARRGPLPVRHGLALGVWLPGFDRVPARAEGGASRRLDPRHPGAFDHGQRRPAPVGERPGPGRARRRSECVPSRPTPRGPSTSSCPSPKASTSPPIGRARSRGSSPPFKPDGATADELYRVSPRPR